MFTRHYTNYEIMQQIPIFNDVHYNEFNNYVQT